MRKLTHKDVQTGFAKRGWELISTEYEGSQKSLLAYCDKGHETTITWNNFQRGQGCRLCAGNIKYDFEYVKSEFEKRGLKLLEVVYINNLEPMKFVCRCGTQNKVRFADILRDKYCQVCKAAKSSLRMRASDDDIRALCSEHKCTFVRSWIAKRKTNIQYICRCGKTAEALLSNFKRCPNCWDCGVAKKTGANCWMYDPDREAVAMRKAFRKKCEQYIRRFMKATGQKKTKHTHELLGYRPQELQDHILNHPDYKSCIGKVWHVDHIFPVQAFLDHGILDLKVINSLSNLRPMLGPENLSKADSYDEKEFVQWLTQQKLQEKQVLRRSSKSVRAGC